MVKATIIEEPTRPVVVKKIHGEKIVYVLRCLWTILEDDKPETLKAIRWCESRVDAFIIEDEVLLDQYLKKYDMFQTNFGTFRRSLYFYGFKKRKNVWSHPNLNKDDRKSLLNIHRKKKENKISKLQAQLRKKYKKLIRDSMMQGVPQFTMPNMVGKNTPTNRRSPPIGMMGMPPFPGMMNPMAMGNMFPPSPFSLPPFGFARSPTYTDMQMFQDDQQPMKTESTKDTEDAMNKIPTRLVNGRNVATLESPSFNNLPGFFDAVPAGLKSLMPNIAENTVDESSSDSNIILNGKK